MKKRTEVEEQEYAPNAAAAARAQERERLDRWRKSADAREARQRQQEREAAAERAKPIADREQISDAVADLAAAWGLKRKQVRR